MKILNIIDIPWNSALAAYAFDQSLALSGRGHSIYFAAPAKSAAADFAKAHKFPLTLIPGRKSLFILGALSGLKKLIDTEGIDIINAHTGRAQTMAFLLTIICSKPPVVVRTKADARKPANGITLSKTAKIVVGSKAIREMYLSAGAPNHKLEVVYQGVPQQPAEDPAPAHPLKVGILGRLDPVKGHEYFIQAAALILQKGLDAEFLIAGKEVNVRFEELRKMAKALKIDAQIKYLGHLSDPQEFIRSCDLGIIASTGSEAVSRAALEWMAAGKPVIATTVGSLPEFISARCLVQPKDPVSLAEKATVLLSSPDTRKKEGAANRRKIEEKFNYITFSRATERIFLSVVNDR